MNVFISLLKLTLIISPLIIIGVHGLIKVKKDYKNQRK